MWVKSVALMVRRTLPVYPNQLTFSDAVGMSQRCQQRKSVRKWKWALRLLDFIHIGRLWKRVEQGISRFEIGTAALCRRQSANRRQQFARSDRLALIAQKAGQIDRRPKLEHARPLIASHHKGAFKSCFGGASHAVLVTQQQPAALPVDLRIIPALPRALNLGKRVIEQRDRRIRRLASRPRLPPALPQRAARLAETRHGIFAAPRASHRD